MEEIPAGVRGFLTAVAELRTGDTSYAKNGDVPVVLAILLVLLLSAGTVRFSWRKMASKATKNESDFVGDFARLGPQPNYAVFFSRS